MVLIKLKAIQNRLKHLNEVDDDLEVAVATDEKDIEKVLEIR